MEEIKINLLEETETALQNHGLNLRNIKYILNKEGYITVADFIVAARNINYNNGYGIVIIDPTLKIVGSNWWLQRFNYDGKEGWLFIKKPFKPSLPAVNFNLLEPRSLAEQDLIYYIEE